MPPQDQTQPIDSSVELAKKRAMAQMAMEGEERRLKREQEEKFRKEKELLDQRKQNEKIRMQGEAARQEIERLAQIKRLREDRATHVVEEKMATAEVRENPNITLSPIRTLKFDMSTMIKDTKASVVSMAIKEDEKRRMMETGVIQEKKKNYILIGFSVILLIGGLTALGFWAYGAYKAKQLATVPNSAKTVDSIIFAEDYTDIVVTNENAITLSAKLRSDVPNNNIPIGSVKYYRFIDNATGQIRVLTAGEWLAKLNVAAPDTLLRLIGDTFMYGIYSGAQNSGFIILQTSYYEKAFAGMLAWEGSLAHDLYPILSGSPVTPELQNTRFTDVSIKNIDARVLKNANGKTELIYAFLPNRTTVVIAHNEATILEVLTRLTTPKPQVTK
ncbi:MAG: hypothetical protein WC764_02280 [Candidatus Paceibacterota bacterium]|jgi:hypothetical protein